MSQENVSSKYLNKCLIKMSLQNVSLEYLIKVSYEIVSSKCLIKISH